MRRGEARRCARGDEVRVGGGWWVCVGDGCGGGGGRRWWRRGGGRGESSSRRVTAAAPAASGGSGGGGGGGAGGLNICNQVYERLVAEGNEEAAAPDFRAQLEAHFMRLPHR